MGTRSRHLPVVNPVRMDMQASGIIPMQDPGILRPAAGILMHAARILMQVARIFMLVAVAWRGPNIVILSVNGRFGGQKTAQTRPEDQSFPNRERAFARARVHLFFFFFLLNQDLKSHPPVEPHMSGRLCNPPRASYM